MNSKKWIFLFAFLGLLIFTFLQRDLLKIVYLRGAEVRFPNLPKVEESDPSIFIVGSESTLNAKLVERISKECSNLSITTKVNRYTNLDWQEKNELHRFIRQGQYKVVLIESDPVDFTKRNKDQIARFESSARKANSELSFWSGKRPEISPPNFLKDLPNDLRSLCSRVAE